MVDTDNNLYHGIALDSTDAFPRDIASKILAKMKQLGGCKSDFDLAKIIGGTLGQSAISSIRKERSGGSRLYKNHVETFLKKRPDIPFYKLLDGIAPAECLLLKDLPGDIVEKEQPAPDRLAEKSIMPAEQRDRFIIALQKLSGNLSIHTISNYLGQEWVDFFLYSGIMPAIWLKKISILEDFKATSELFNLSSLETADTISEEQQLEISKWKEATLKERESKGAISPVKRTPPKEPPPASYGAGKKPDGEQSAGNEKMVSILLNNAGVPLEISDAFFEGLLRAGKASHLKLSIETLMGTVMKLLPNCPCVFLHEEKHIRVKKEGVYYKLDVSRLNII